MKQVLWVLFVSILALTFIACGGADDQTNTNTQNTNAANNESPPNPEILASITSLEKEAHEAAKNKNGKFFDDFLTGGFVGVGSLGVAKKQKVMESITGSKCEIKNFELSDEKLFELSEGIVLLTSKYTSEKVCGGKTAPSPEWKATVYVKTGDKWHAAFHQTIPASDAKGENPAPASDSEEIKQPADINTELTATLGAIEKNLWEAWSKKEGKVFEEALAANGVFLPPEGAHDRAAEVKSVSGHKCELKTFSNSEMRSAKISDKVVLLTYRADVDGVCDGKKIPSKSWTSTIFVMEGDKWKPAFHMSSPAP